MIIKQFSIFQLPIMHFVSPPPPHPILHKLLFWEYAVLPREFETIVYAKSGEANQVYYGPLENRELFYYRMKKRLLVCSGNLFISMKEGS